MTTGCIGVFGPWQWVIPYSNRVIMKRISITQINMAVSVLHLKLYPNLCTLDKIKYPGKRAKKNNFKEVKRKVYCGNQ
jgi:hypothetical protein